MSRGCSARLHLLKQDTECLHASPSRGVDSKITLSRSSQFARRRPRRLDASILISPGYAICAPVFGTGQDFTLRRFPHTEIQYDCRADSLARLIFVIATRAKMLLPAITLVASIAMLRAIGRFAEMLSTFRGFWPMFRCAVKLRPSLMLRFLSRLSRDVACIRFAALPARARAAAT